MIRVAFASVLARWPRAVATSLAVVAGVGVVSGTLMVSDTAEAVLVGLFGIINVLALSLVERSRELMLLRAVGLDRGQVRAMVRAEATVIATVGVGGGVGLGVLFGWATARVLEQGSQPIRFDLPAGQLAVIAASALLAALVAAALPAAWAGRLPLLRG